MKIIDFACRFLTRLQEGELTIVGTQVLLAVAAGLDTSADIARLTGLAQGTCTQQLRALEREKLIICICRTSGFYRLAADGKTYVYRLFSFAQKHGTCERNDT